MDHLEALRWHLVRSAVVVLVLSIGSFIFMDFIFNTIIMGPKHIDFWTYRQMCRLGEMMGMAERMCPKELKFTLMNTTMAGQFMQHIKLSFTVGIAVAFPYVGWELWRFFSPALNGREKRLAAYLIAPVILFFLTGMLFGYYVLTPMTIQFLANYMLSPDIANNITLDSYLSTLTLTCLSTAVIFELPMIILLMASLNLVTVRLLRKGRKMAIIIILVLAAVLTPSPDPQSQMLLAVPFYALYELSIWVAYGVERRRALRIRAEERALTRRKD